MADIFVIMGKSSSGKDTIFSRLVGQADCGLKTVTMYTTRPMRDGEVAVSYTHLTLPTT